MRLHVATRLRWSDFDAYAHVNNAEMLRLLEEARIEAFWRPEDGVEAPHPTAVMGGPGSPTLSLIARQEIEYLLPIPYMRAPIDIELWLGRVGGASVEVCYEVHSPEGVTPRVLYARAATTLVMVEAASGRPVRIGDEAREAWAPFVEEPVAFGSRR